MLIYWLGIALIVAGLVTMWKLRPRAKPLRRVFVRRGNGPIEMLWR